MIVEYDPASGRILHVVFDPVPEGPRAATPGTQALDLPPVPHFAPAMLNGEPLLNDDGEPVMETTGSDLASIDINCDYVSGGQLRRRPECPATVALDARTITIGDLPEGATMTVVLGGVAVPVADTVIEVDEAGPLQLRIVSPWPYLEAVHDLDIE